MGVQCLEIRRLSKNGEVLKTIRCFAGRVTVLRARADQAIEPYVRSLRGHQTAECFAFVVDGNAFDVRDHMYIGSCVPAIDGKVSEILSKRGLTAEQIAQELAAIGLAEKASMTTPDLTEPELRALELLCACFEQEKIIILENAFEPLDVEVREALASRLAEQAWKAKIVVLVVGLRDRPECWIDNELISRIQIDDYRRRSTVGFGVAPGDTNQELQKLRAQLSGPEQVTYFDSRSDNPLVTEQHQQEVAATRLGTAIYQRRIRIAARVAVVLLILSIGAYRFFYTAPVVPAGSMISREAREAEFFATSMTPPPPAPARAAAPAMGGPSVADVQEALTRGLSEEAARGEHAEAVPAVTP